ncbi:hypothetical protein PGT21_027903 [Puccinia graminis f. sp. tritici]|uniref:ATP-dependent DNA helicase sgs1 n=1 Tax=Puccinia graminis f. sp. tritici TaxID=56615 RepID=A0A5B0Q6Q1_PUCGR|nr:hypothetical protein PGT21_027903 [Puccinia graminis f. sp. tritici]
MDLNRLAWNIDNGKWMVATEDFVWEGKKLGVRNQQGLAHSSLMIGVVFVRRTELSPVLLDFAGSLVEKFVDFFWEKYPEAASFLPEHLFGLDEATNIARHIPDIDSPKDLLNDTRGNPVNGQLELLYESVVEFHQGVVFHNHLNAEEEKRRQKDIEKKMKRRQTRSKANGKSEEQIAIENARLADKRSAAEREKERKFIAAEKRRNDSIRRKEETEKKNEEKKRKWEEDRVHLEVYKKLALEASSKSTSGEGTKQPEKAKPRPTKVVLSPSNLAVPSE